MCLQHIDQTLIPGDSACVRAVLLWPSVSSDKRYVPELTSSISSDAIAAIGGDPSDFILVVANFTPVPREGYRVGVPADGFYRELLNSDSTYFGGGNMGNVGGIPAEPMPWQGQAYSLMMTIPPLAVIFFKPDNALSTNTI
jgi:Alpha amylase, C-terminal all-beta domain